MALQAEPATGDRRARVTDFKRGLIREAAWRVFTREGIEGASLRAIAAAAGSTTGAIYVHYATKEELYADLLRESLASLHEELGRAAHGARPEHRARAVLEAFLGFYRERPQAFDLSFYLHGGARPVGLSSDLDRDLNTRMTEIVDLVGEATAGTAASDAERRRRGTAASASVFGLVLMLRTGRLAVLDQDADELLNALTP